MTTSPDRCRRSGLSRCRDERGQMTALVLPLLFALVLFVAMVANVGQAVNRRIALQVLADTTAYTGGSVMATGMNHLAYWNRQLQRRYVTISNLTADFFYTIGVCEAAGNGALTAAKAAHHIVHTSFWAVNHEFGEVVEEKTEEVFNFNRADLFPGEAGFALWHESDEFNLPDTPPFTDELVALVKGVSEGTDANHERHDWGNETLSNTWGVPPWFDLFGAEAGGPGFYTKTWECFDPCYWCIPTPFGCICISNPVATDSMQVLGGEWYELINPLGALPHMFVAGVTAPATKALMFDDFFGPNAIPEMNAVAVSHPVGGNIKDGESTYVNRFVPVRRLMYAFGNFNGEIADPLFGLNRKVTH